MMDLLIATHNPGKLKEMAELFEGFPARLHSLRDLGIETPFEEGEEDFATNALGKARFYFEKSGMPTVSDDSGILVTALSGELGVMTRRWGAGEHAGDEEWLAFFLRRMEEEADRSARFVCAAAYVDESCEKVCFGETRGLLTMEIEAPLTTGIPLSSVFRPEGYDRVYAALGLAEKNAVSHRGKAFVQLISFLKSICKQS